MDQAGAGWPPSLRDYGERRLVAELLEDRYRDTVSFGDDCALLSGTPAGPFELVATTDPCPEPLVASLGWDDLYYYGWLLGTINFSDLAAAGAEPLGLLVSYLLPESQPVSAFERLLDGVDDCCQAHGSRVVGGNLGEAASVQLTATAIGACPAGKRVSRRGARAGDALLLVGSPGYLWSAALLQQEYATVSAEDREYVLARALKPIANMRAGQLLSQARLTRAAIDVSDGLYPSVEALCRASGLGAVIEPAAAVLEARPLEICRQAGVDPFAMTQLWGDWTLLIAVDHDAVEQAAALLGTIEVACHQIGYLREGSESWLSRAGRLTAWNGADAERFTGSSWRRSKLSDYVHGLVRSSSG